MGGSGGGFFFDPKNYSNKIREAENGSLDKSYDADVNSSLNDVLSSINDRSVEDINRHLDTIKKKINSEINGVVDLFFGGSVNKKTYVEGISDVDSLVILNDTELEKMSPSEVLHYFEKKISERLPFTEIRKGSHAVTVKFSDGVEIQLLPALKTASGIKIASNSQLDTWSNVVKPHKFAQKLTDINKANSNKVVPVVKLAKAIISNFPETRKLSGYHAESLAIDVFKKYEGPLQTKAMLKHFFKESSRMVLSPIKDSTGQTRHVDDYLKGRNSIERRKVADSLSQIVRRMSNADAKRDSESWLMMFD